MLTATLVLAQEERWATVGHEVAFGQAILPAWTGDALQIRNVVAECPSAPVYAPLAENGSLRVVQGDINLGVQGAGFSLIFSSAQGNLVSYRYGGRELIEELPQPSFLRAPVDNDYGSGRMADCAQWKERRAQSVTVRFTYALTASPSATCTVTYTVDATGALRVALDYEAAEGLPEMPDFAMLFTLSADYDRIRFYGYGPKENYIDRCEGARLGIYESTAADEVEPYLRPQETGNHCGVRWVEVTDRSGHGIRLAGDVPFEASALPYSPHELENARHAYDLPRPQHTYLRASAGMCGVGGDDSWGAPVLAEYTYPNGKRSLSFTMKGI